MKKFLLPLFCLVLSYTAKGQFQYSTTMELKALKVVKVDPVTKKLKLTFTKDNLERGSELLAPYLSAEIQSQLAHAKNGAQLDSILAAAFKENPFFTISTAIQHGDNFFDKEKPSVNLVNSAISKIGALDVTNFADGLAKFLVERTKKELSITFFERFKKDLDLYPQLKVLFPASYKALQAIGEEIYNYAAYIDLLRESFQKDLTLLLPNIKNLIDDPSMDKIFSQYPEIRTMFADGLYIAVALNGGVHPGEAIHNYVNDQADSAKLRAISQYIYPSLQTLDFFSESLRSKQDDQYWIGSDSLKLLTKDESIFKLYIGLIYEQSKIQKIYFDKTSLDAELKKLAVTFDSLKKIYLPFIVGLVEKGKSVDYYYQTIRKIQSSGNSKPTYQDYFSLYDASLNFLEYLVNGKSLFNLPKLNKYDKRIEKYFASARSLGNIYVDVYEKQYTSAVVEFSSLYKKLIVKEYTDLQDSLKIEKVTAEKKKSIIKKIEGLNFLKDQEKFTLLYVKYGGLAAEISKAETSDDVQKAIEAFALPTGSARIKRESPFNVSINAYTGIYAGYERVKGLDHAYKPFKYWNTYGLTAPVGVAVSFGARKFLWMGKGHWSYSCFVSLIDIGAIASFRFNSADSVAQIPKVQLKDIVSPGVFFSIGIPKTPLSINIGTQMGANLRKIDATSSSPMPTNQLTNKVYWRYSASICVDIPLINLFTKSR
jgi:hypothetical protein